MIIVKSNLPQFRATLLQYLRVTSDTLERAIIRKAYRLALGALRLTKRASRNEIETLGVIGYELNYSKVAARKGITQYNKNIQGKAIVEPRSRARAIVVNKLRRAGNLSAETGASVTEKARSTIMSRIKAIGYIASGLLPAVRKLGREVGAIGFSDVKQIGPPKGTVEVDRNAWNPKVTITNDVSAQKNERVSEYLVSGMERAMGEEIADMEIYITRKLKEDASRFGARLI